MSLTVALITAITVVIPIAILVWLIRWTDKRNRY
jgi:hypothetical protein